MPNREKSNSSGKGVHMLSLIEMENSLFVRRLELYEGMNLDDKRNKNESFEERN